MSNFFQRLLSALFLLPPTLFAIYNGGIIFNLFLAFASFFIFLELIKLENIFSKLSICVLLLLFLFSLFQLRQNDYGEKIIILTLILTSLSDIGGYFFGKFFGGKKINFISHNKTYIGFLGSLIFPQIATIYIYSSNDVFINSLFSPIIITIITIASISGDLLFSYFKRLNGIKDFSNIIPGHGGVLDRVDGLIFSIIIVFIISNII